MLCKATTLIARAMDEKNYKYGITEKEKSSILYAGFSIDNGPNVQCKFISTDDDNDVAVRLYGLISGITDSNRGKILEVINKCNNSYRFVTFLIDSDGDVNIQYDFPVTATDDAIGVMSCEIFARIMNIVEECYPLFMKALWS